MLCVVLPVTAQDFPPLTETFTGSGRLDNLTFAYPEGWHTLGGIPVNRFISFNIVSSLPIGLNTRVEPGESAVVMAIAGGRIDRWNTIEAGASAEQVLLAFFERLGDDNRFGRAEEDGRTFEQVTEAFTVNGMEAVLIRFVETSTAPETESAVNAEFVAYAVKLDDNQFMVMLVLASEYSYDELVPLMDDVFASMVFVG
jgi:hypothetical protein